MESNLYTIQQVIDESFVLGKKNGQIRLCNKQMLRDKLFNAKITDSDSCHVCESKQTLEHLLVACQHVHSFWNLFTSWLNDNNSPSVSLTNNAKI